MISAVILTKNEEKVIDKCIKGVVWCDEIVIIDDYSSDNTLEKIRKLKIGKVKIYKHYLNDDFARQRNYGLAKAKGDWILFVDADEVVRPLLAEEIGQKIEGSHMNGFWIKREDYFLGKNLRFGETGKVKLVRLARKGAGKWERKVHEYWEVKGEIGELKNPICHNAHSDLRDFVDNINYFSSMHADALKKEGKRSNLVKIIVWPVGKFWVNYVLKLGFLDGMAGFIMAFLMSFHSFLAWSKQWKH